MQQNYVLHIVSSCTSLLIVFLLCATAVHAQQWYWQRPLPQGNTLRDIHALDADNAVAVGDHGTFMRTTDGGQNWTIRHRTYDLTDDWHAVQFISPERGLVVGARGIAMRTDDGGETWNPVTLQTELLRDVAVFGSENNYAVAVGNEGKAFRSQDGGEFWEALPFPSIKHLTAVRFFTEDIGIVTAEGGEIFRTMDRGEEWAEVLSPTQQTVNALEVLSETIAIGVGTGGSIVRTTDAGATWETVAESGDSYQGLAFLNEMNGIAVGANGRIATTDDGGATWKDAELPIAETDRDTLFAVDFFDIEQAMAVGRFGVMPESPDRGASWNSRYALPRHTWFDVAFTSEMTGTVVGTQGKIFRTGDGGVTWYDQNSGTTDSLTAIYAINESVATIVGVKGLILRTENGGETWIRQSPGPAEVNLTDVFFLDAKTGYATGYNGTILMTTDGGIVWDTLSSGIKQLLNAIYFSTPDSGMAVGRYGVVSATTDGGKTWQSRFNPYIQDLYELAYRPADMQYPLGLWAAIGNAGTVVASTNFGEVWSLRNGPPIPEPGLRGVRYLDKDTGWAAGLDGRILKTVNGGVSWEPVPNITGNNLQGIELAGERIILVGEGGTIISTTPGGASSINRDESEAAEAVAGGMLAVTAYPNPFNRETTISLRLTEQASCVLEVFNEHGESVMRTSEVKLLAGEMSIRFYADNLPSGMYYYVVTATTATGTPQATGGKLVLIR